MMSRLLEVHMARDGGIFPGLMCLSRYDVAEQKITLYNDAIRQMSERSDISFSTVRRFALFHECLHFLFPRQPGGVHKLSRRLKEVLGIMPADHDR